MKKSCPNCHNKVNSRAAECDECGHKFAHAVSPAPPAPVSAASALMTSSPLEKAIKESATAARDVIDRVERRNAVEDDHEEKPVYKPRPQPVVPPPSTSGKIPLMPQRAYVGGIIAPAGACPVKPKGYKEDWPEGPASREVIEEWALDVMNSGNKTGQRYAPSAIVYFSQQFWNVNGPDYLRVRTIILNLLLPDHYSETETDS